MLSSNDLAELIESTRDQVKHMGGDSPAAVGAVQVLNGLITVLRDQVSGEVVEPEPAASSAQQYAEEPASDESQSQASGEDVPGYLQHLRAQRRAGGGRRRPVRESYDKAPKAANPLLSPQYSGFFNALIAQQKSPDPRAADEQSPSGEAAPEESAQSDDEPPHPSHDATATG